jgi:signal transduction histidine kinase
MRYANSFFMQGKVGAKPRWRHYLNDSLLAIGGVGLVTAVIALVHLYPKIPTITFVYLLLVVALAGRRGLYAAIVASLLSFLAFDFFFFPPQYTFIILNNQDLLTLSVFLVMAIITGQLASAQRRRAEEANTRASELRLLYEQAQELAALQERQRLARELHDSVSQTLYAIGLGTSTVQNALENDPEQANASLEYVNTLVEAGLAEMRALIFELRPEFLEAEGLVAGLLKQVDVLRARHRLTVETSFDEEPALSLDKKYALYRVGQEALHNIVRHARASTVSIRLTEREDEVTLEIEDDGRGFDPSAAFPGHLGLRSMRERIAKVGGTLALESTISKGTSIRVRVPKRDIL